MHTNTCQSPDFQENVSTPTQYGKLLDKKKALLVLLPLVLFEGQSRFEIQFC